jgi:hypothetical protein
MIAAAPVATAAPAARASPAPKPPADDTAGTTNFNNAGNVNVAMMINTTPSICATTGSGPADAISLNAAA